MLLFIGEFFVLEAVGPVAEVIDSKREVETEDSNARPADESLSGGRVELGEGGCCSRSRGR